MADLAGPWAGTIYGTNTGNLFAEFEQTGNKLKGEIRISDDRYGITIYKFTGIYDESIILDCIPLEAPEGLEAGSTTVNASLKPDGTLYGKWESEIGTAGMFRLWPHNSGIGAESEKGVNQVYNRTADIGSIRMFKEDLKGIFDLMQEDFSEGKLIVTYEHEGDLVTKHADNFLESLSEIKHLNSLKVFIQEQEVAGINRSVSVELLDTVNDSNIRVFGVNKTWVTGKTQLLKKHIEKYQNTIVTNYRKYGLNLNSIIFLLMLVFVSEIPNVSQRLIFVFGITILLVILHFIHSMLIPNTIIFLGSDKVSFISRAWPSLISWLSAVSAAVVATFIYHFLK